MTPAAIWRVVRMDLRRHGRELGASSVSIGLAVAGLVFFLALALGVRAVLLGDVFPVDRLDVAPAGRSLDILALRFQLGADTMDRAQLDRLAQLPGVAAVYPRLQLEAPALASGGESLLGTTLQTEVAVDGVPPGLVSDELGTSFQWRPLAREIRCARATDCPEDAYCGDGVYGAAGVCRSYVPALLSQRLVELYNGSFRRAYGLPRLNPDFVVGLSFEMSFGASTLRPARPGVVRERARIVGFSDRAIPLGVTLPLEEVRDLNARLASAGSGDRFHSATLLLADKHALPGVVQAVEKMGLVVKSEGARQAATLMAVLLAVVGILGAAMLVMAVLSVSHSFYLMVRLRRREIAVLRSVGARRGDIRSTILAEAAAVGVVAGGVGTVVAVAAAAVLNRLAATRIPDFPYKPETFFAFPLWLPVGALAVALLAGVLGAWLPARRAAAADPAEMIAGS